MASGTTLTRERQGFVWHFTNVRVTTRNIFRCLNLATETLVKMSFIIASITNDADDGFIANRRHVQRQFLIDVLLLAKDANVCYFIAVDECVWTILDPVPSEVAVVVSLCSIITRRSPLIHCVLAPIVRDVEVDWTGLDWTSRRGFIQVMRIE